MLIVHWWIKFTCLSYKCHLLIAFLIRLAFIAYGTYHDEVSAVPYTDVDYRVFTDAARHIIAGNSPYDRHTYRYTPLIAFFLIPNLLLSHIFGKILFCCIDIFVGILIRLITNQCWLDYMDRNEIKSKFVEAPVDERKENVFVTPKIKNCSDLVADSAMLVWLYNPLTIAVSTRGNCDSIAGFLVLLVLYYIQCRHNYFVAGIIHGLAVHVRLYPLVYSLALFMHLSSYSYTDKASSFKFKHGASKFLKDVKNTNSKYESTEKYKMAKQLKNIENKITKNLDEERKTIFRKEYLLYLIPNRDQIALISGCLFSLGFLTATFYYLYGYRFLYETYFFHLFRKDTKHNFSLYFYLQYLTAGVKNVGIWQKVLCVLPQIVLLLVFSVRYGLNKLSLNFSILTQTIVMVAYNTVLTSQYFIWIMVILPLCLWQIKLSFRSALFFILIWFSAQGAWLLPAYFLEFRGQNTFMFIWVQSVALFCAHMAILGRLIINFMPKKCKEKL